MCAYLKLLPNYFEELVQMMLKVKHGFINTSLVKWTVSTMEILMKDVFICLRPKDMSGHGFSFLEESWRILRLIETNLLSSDKAA